MRRPRTVWGGGRRWAPLLAVLLLLARTMPALPVLPGPGAAHGLDPASICHGGGDDGAVGTRHETPGPASDHQTCHLCRFADPFLAPPPAVVAPPPAVAAAPPPAVPRPTHRPAAHFLTCLQPRAPPAAG